MQKIDHEDKDSKQLQDLDKLIDDLLQNQKSLLSELIDETNRFNKDNTSCNYLKLAIFDHTGESMKILELPDNLIIGQLVPALVADWGLPTRQRNQTINYILTSVDKSSRLSSMDTLASAGIESGDRLVLFPDITAGGGIFVRSFRDIQIINAYLSHKEISNYRQYTIYAIILYTSSDENITNFIRSHLMELHQMADNTCAFYVVEQPNREWLPVIRKDLVDNLGPYAEQVWSRINVDQLTPIDKNVAYEIAKHLGIEFTQLPCIAFFTDLDSKNLLTISFSHFLDKNISTANTQDLIQVFRLLFDAVRKASIEQSSDRLSKLKKEISKISTKATGQKTFSKIADITLEESIKVMITSIVKLLIV